MGVLKKWREMSWFRRVLVALLAGMILGGGIATTVVTGREGIKYQDTLLLLTREGEACRYTGRLDGERAEFTVRPAAWWSTAGGRRPTAPISMWDIRNPEKAEPSDWYLFSERVTWIACTGLAAYLYWINLTGIN